MKQNYQFLSIQQDEHIYTLLLQAPPLNIITRELLQELDEAFQELELQPDLRAVILSSSLPQIFCAGADIKQFCSWNGTTGSESTLYGSRVFLRIEQFPHPVLCAVNGPAFGGGVELALACDIRIVDPRAQMSLPECSLGMQPGYGGTQRLPRIVGPSCAKKLMFSGQPISAQEAFRVGLADELSAEGGSLEAALNLAKTIAGQAPIAVSCIKKSVHFAMEHPIEEGIIFENHGIAMLCETKDKAEGAKAFLEKRPPVFRNC